MNITKQSFFSWKKIILAAIIALGLASIGYHFYFSGQKEQIVDYQKHDRRAVLDLFEKNWYWLIPEGVEFSAEYWLDNKAATQTDPQDKGKETIKVLYVNDQLAGFVSYNMKKFYQGFVHFLAVDEKFRSKGYGLKLFEYALDELKKQGAAHIYLVTRTTNYPAQKVYKKAGFKETNRTNGFVHFDYYA